MLYVRIDAINEIPFNELKSNYITASFTLLPIGIDRLLTTILDNPTGYSSDIISFPICDSHLYSLRIALQSKRESVYDFCEVVLSLKYFRVNRYYKFRAQTDSEVVNSTPLIDLSLQISSAKYKPFECHRSHVSFECEESNEINQNNDDDAINKNELIARYWFSIVPEEQWSLIFRPGFLDIIKEKIDHFHESDLQPPKQQEKLLKVPRRNSVPPAFPEHNPLNPPQPNNEPLPKFKFPQALIETHFM